MSDKVRKYEGEKITVTYEVARCILAGECAYGLKAVFNPDRKPWVDANAADVDDVAETVIRCPSGALKFDRKDGGQDERVPAKNVVWIIPHGPVHIRGDMKLDVGDEKTMDEFRVSLCRCGASENKPFCDGSHTKVDFTDPAEVGTSSLAKGRSNEPHAVLEITPAADGPLLLKGPFELAGADFEVRFAGAKAALCRCGHSENKPFCDGTHKTVEFKSE